MKRYEDPLNFLRKDKSSYDMFICHKMLKNSQLLNELIIKEEDKKKCVVCFDKEAGHNALVPCGHTQFCHQCIEEITKRTNVCSLCKTKIESVLKIYS